MHLTLLCYLQHILFLPNYRLRSLSLEISNRLNNNDSIDELGDCAMEVDDNGVDMKQSRDFSAKYQGISTSGWVCVF